MIYYWLILILFLLLAIGSNKNEVSKGDDLRLIIPLTLLFIFFAFRIGFTPDYYNYENEFESNYGNAYNNDQYIHKGELIHLTVIRILPYRTALIIQAALLCFCVFVTFRYYVPRKHWWLAVALFFTYANFLLGNLSAYRSSYVTMALLPAIIMKAKYKKGWVWAALIIFVSSMIHHSALFLLPFVLLSNRPFGKQSYSFLVVLACIVIFLSLFMANTINNVVNGIFSQFTDEFDSYKVETIQNVRSLGAFTLLRWFMLGYLLFITLKYTRMDFGRARNICIKLTAIFFMIDFLPGVMLIDRITYNLAFPVVIGVTSIVDKMTDKNERALFVGMAVLYGIWELYLMLNSPALMAVHSSYQNILFN